MAEDPVGIELYDHSNDDGTDFDISENVNVANKKPDIVKKLSKEVHDYIKEYNI